MPAISWPAPFPPPPPQYWYKVQWESGLGVEDISASSHKYLLNLNSFTYTMRRLEYMISQALLKV